MNKRLEWILIFSARVLVILGMLVVAYLNMP